MYLDDFGTDVGQHAEEREQEIAEETEYYDRDEAVPERCFHY